LSSIAALEQDVSDRDGQISIVQSEKEGLQLTISNLEATVIDLQDQIGVLNAEKAAI
jgi:phage shock protein A